MSKPLLSVTITNYNYAEYIGQAIESVLNQTFKDFELIIIDNASTDNSIAIIKQYASSDARIRLIEHTENKGIIVSLLEAYRLSIGRYMVHIDADDWIIDPHAFERQIELMEREIEVAFVFSQMILADSTGKKIPLPGPYDHEIVLRGEEGIEQMLALTIAHSGPMIRMSAYHACGGHDTSFYHAIDIKLWHDLCTQGKIAYLNQPLYATRQHRLSLSKITRIRTLQKEGLRLIDIVFKGPLAQKMPHPKAARRRAIRRMMVHYSIQFVFSDQYRSAWQAYWVSFTLQPVNTFFQKQTIVLIARTIVGAKGYQAFEKLFARFSRRKREQILAIDKLRNELSE